MKIASRWMVDLIVTNKYKINTKLKVSTGCRVALMLDFLFYWWEVMKKPNTHSLTIYIACIFTYTVTFSCVSFTRIILCLLAVGKVWECWVSMKLVFTVSFHVLFVLKLEFIMILRQIHLSFFIFIQVYFSNTFF